MFGKRGGLIVWGIIFLLVLFILYKAGFLRPVSEHMAKFVAFPKSCESVYPEYYRDNLYEQCALKEYGISYDDFVVETSFDYTQWKCEITIKVKDKVVKTGKIGYKEAFEVTCDEILEAAGVK